MPINLCKCGVRYAIGLLRCPRCTAVAPQYAVKEEETMPRITVADGPTNAGAAEGEVGFVKRAERKAKQAVEKVVTEIRGEHGPELALDWASKPVAHLRKAAEVRGLNTAGSKGDLATRLTEHDAAQADAEPVKVDAEPEEVSA